MTEQAGDGLVDMDVPQQPGPSVVAAAEQALGPSMKDFFKLDLI
jgi:hypothetical protein